MRIKTIGVTALVTLAAAATVDTVAYAEPVPAQVQPATVRGSEHGIAYEVSKNADGPGLTAQLSGGTFTMTDSAVLLTDPAGAVVASLPLTLAFEQGTVELRPRIDATGTRLTADPVGYWQQTSPRERSIWSGAAIGGFVGAVIGMVGILGGPLVIVTGLAGALIGAAIGAGIGAAVPNSDAPDRWTYVDPNSPKPPDNDCFGHTRTFGCR